MAARGSSIARARATAAATTWPLRASTASSAPAPRPVATPGAAPASSAVRHAALVVLPMPISPASSSRSPAATAASASASPARHAASNAATPIAGPCARLAVPGATRAARKNAGGDAGAAAATPTSTRRRSQPALAANAEEQARPASIVATISPVTSDGQADTPSATAP